MHHVRHLILVLGDQLDLDAAAFDGFDPAQDAVWMAEAHEESTHVWSSKQRIALFLSAMRHFAQALRDAGRPLHYHRLDDTGAAVADLGSLGAKLQADISFRLKPQRVVMTAPGDWRVFQQLKAAVEAAGLKLEVCEDRHFFTTVSELHNACQWAKVAAAGVLLPRAAATLQHPDGRRQARGWPVEF